jgi:hypothetical protein
VAALANSTSTATKTWHFKLKNARDLSWASSAAFILDGAKINLQVEKSIGYQLIRLKAPVMRLGTFNRIYQGIH